MTINADVNALQITPKAIDTLKSVDAGNLSGRSASKGFWKSVMYVIKAIWSFIMSPFGYAAMAFSAGCAFLALAASKSRNEDSLVSRVALYANATLCFIGAGAAIAVGCMKSAGYTLSSKEPLPTLADINA